MTNCDGRCRGGWAFGQGFDSPQVHRKQHRRALPYGAVFFIALKEVDTRMVRKLRFRTGAHDVQWTSVLGRPERSGDRLPEGSLGLSRAKGQAFGRGRKVPVASVLRGRSREARPTHRGL